MKKLYSWLIKKLWNIDSQCDKCGRVFTTERGKNIHRASHLKQVLIVNKHQKRLIGHIKGIKFVVDKKVPRNQVVVKNSHNPLEGQDVELFLRGSLYRYGTDDSDPYSGVKD